MTKTKYYFRTKNDEYCYNKLYFDYIMEENGIENIEVYEAVQERIKNVFWCIHLNYIVDANDYNPCGKICGSYDPRNGKSGICNHHSKILYTRGKKITLKKT